MKNFIIILFFAGIAALTISSKVSDKRHVSKDMLRFIESKNYTYSKMKSAIPEIVIKGIHESGGFFNPGDIGDSGKIGFGCLRSGGEKYEGLLKFVMVNDSFCLIYYSHGSYAIRNTVYFIKYRPTFRLVEFYNLGYWSDTTEVSLVKALQKRPEPDIIWTKPD